MKEETKFIRVYINPNIYRELTASLEKVEKRNRGKLLIKLANDGLMSKSQINYGHEEKNNLVLENEKEMITHVADDEEEDEDQIIADYDSNKLPSFDMEIFKGYPFYESEYGSPTTDNENHEIKRPKYDLGEGAFDEFFK